MQKMCFLWCDDNEIKTMNATPCYASCRSRSSSTLGDGSPMTGSTSSFPGRSSNVGDCELRFGSWTLSTELLTLQPINDLLMGTSISVDSSRFPPDSISRPSGQSSSYRPPSLSAGARSGGMQLIQRTAEWDVLVPRSTTARVPPSYEIQYPWRPGVRYSVVGYRLSLRRRQSRLSTGFRPQQSAYTHGQANDREADQQQDFELTDDELPHEVFGGARPGARSSSAAKDRDRWNSGAPRRQSLPSSRRTFPSSSFSTASPCHYRLSSHSMTLYCAAATLISSLIHCLNWCPVLLTRFNWLMPEFGIWGTQSTERYREWSKQFRFGEERRVNYSVKKIWRCNCTGQVNDLICSLDCRPQFLYHIWQNAIIGCLIFTPITFPVQKQLDAHRIAY